MQLSEHAGCVLKQGVRVLPVTGTQYTTECVCVQSEPRVSASGFICVCSMSKPRYAVCLRVQVCSQGEAVLCVVSWHAQNRSLAFENMLLAENSIAPAWPFLN